jgi:glycosyltransferase involved in cell wall biosynthesis
VVPSQKLLDLATDVWRLPPGRLRLIPNGVDTGRFAVPPEPGIISGFAKADGEPIIGTVAPLRAEKNLGRLIRAFAAVPERLGARLLIVGDGPERTRLEATASSLGIAARVVFAGHVDVPEKVLGWFDVFALSSDTEQMPNALLQAMAASRAVAAVDVGDVAAIVAPKNRRFIVKREDERALAGAITTLLEDEGLRRALGAANHARAAEVYGIDRMVERYRELFESALAPGTAPARADLALAR